MAVGKDYRLFDDTAPNDDVLLRILRPIFGPRALVVLLVLGKPNQLDLAALAISPCAQYPPVMACLAIVSLLPIADDVHDAKQRLLAASLDRPRPAVPA